MLWKKILQSERGNNIVVVMAVVLAVMSFSFVLFQRAYYGYITIINTINEQQSLKITAFGLDLAARHTETVQANNYPPVIKPNDFEVIGKNKYEEIVFSKTYKCDIQINVSSYSESGFSYPYWYYRVDTYRQSAETEQKKRDHVAAIRASRYRTYAGYLWFADNNVPLAGGYPHTDEEPYLDHTDNYMHGGDMFNGPVACNTPLVVYQSSSHTDYNDGWPVFLDRVDICLNEEKDVGALNQYNGRLVEKTVWNSEAAYDIADPEEVIGNLDEDVAQFGKDISINESCEPLVFPGQAEEIHRNASIVLPGPTANIDIYWMKIKGSTAYYLKG